MTEAPSDSRRPQRRTDRIRASGIHYTSKFTRLSSSIRLEPDARSITNSLGRVSRDPEPVLPHVSLLYKEMPGEKQAQFAATIQFPFKTVTFDAVQAMRCRVPVRTSADVAWEIVGTRQFV